MHGCYLIKHNLTLLTEFAVYEIQKEVFLNNLVKIYVALNNVTFCVGFNVIFIFVSYFRYLFSFRLDLGNRLD